MPKMPFEKIVKMEKMEIGRFELDGVEFNYDVTVLKDEHEDAINGGKVYELKIVDFYNGYPMTLYEFEAGKWVTKPKNETELAKRALEYVLKNVLFN